MSETLTKTEAAKALRDLQKEYRDLDVWSKAHTIIGKTDLDDSLFFKYPVKSPFLTIYDNLLNIARELDEMSKSDIVEEMTMEEVCKELGKTIKIKK